MQNFLVLLHGEQLRILSVVKTTLTIIAALAVLGGCLILFTPGCEEVLEACAPCGNVTDGDVNISGDPRLDGTLEAFQRVRRFAESAAAGFDRDKEMLIETFEISEAAGIEEIVAEIESQLLGNQTVDVAIALEPARCWVDAEYAIASELACEELLECNLPRKPSQWIKAPLCTGLFVGECDARCLGQCFDETLPSERSCTEECVGTCSEITGQSCPGMCRGSCSSACSAYRANGECAGGCSGLCTGVCEAPIPFYCGGSCYGHCRVDLGEGNLCRGQCRGGCVDHSGKGKGQGTCRGHLRPAGFDEECSECREMAKWIAWSMLTCWPAAVKLSVDFSPEYEDDRTDFLARVRKLERVLARTANKYAALALLVDGVDVTSELEPQDLTETVSENTPEIDYLKSETDVEDLGVVFSRRFLPLSGLKARVKMLAGTATQGDFLITSNALPCITPAFEEAASLLGEMIPAVNSGADLEMDRACSITSIEADTPCLYRVVDEQAALLTLAELDN